MKLFPHLAGYGNAKTTKARRNRLVQKLLRRWSASKVLAEDVSAIMREGGRGEKGPFRMHAPGHGYECKSMDCCRDFYETQWSSLRMPACLL